MHATFDPIPVMAADAAMLGFAYVSVLLFAAVGLSILAAWRTEESQRSLFAVVGVLLGLLAGGGFGTLFAAPIAKDTAEDVQDNAERRTNRAATRAAQGVKDVVTDKVEEAVDPRPK